MPWNTEITEQDLLLAMHECDHYGVEAFRTLYGERFQQARNLHMYSKHNTHDQRGPYEARPLVAAAWAHHVRDRNYATNHNNGNIHDVLPDNIAPDFLRDKFGFGRENI